MTKTSHQEAMESAAVGRPDPRYGEKVMVFVLLRPRVARPSADRLAVLKHHIGEVNRDHPLLFVLTRYAHIREVESQNKVWGQGGHPLPRTVDRTRRVRADKARQALHAQTQPPTSRLGSRRRSLGTLPGGPRSSPTPVKHFTGRSTSFNSTASATDRTGKFA
jgi:hypothetical protein